MSGSEEANETLLDIKKKKILRRKKEREDIGGKKKKGERERETEDT